MTKTYTQQGITTPVVKEGRHHPITINKRIGSTTYKVQVHFNASSGETIEDKILRLVKSEGFQNADYLLSKG